NSASNTASQIKASKLSSSGSQLRRSSECQHKTAIPSEIALYAHALAAIRRAALFPRRRSSENIPPIANSAIAAISSASCDALGSIKRFPDDAGPAIGAAPPSLEAQVIRSPLRMPVREK